MQLDYVGKTIFPTLVNLSLFHQMLCSFSLFKFNGIVVKLMAQVTDLQILVCDSFCQVLTHGF